MVLSEITLNSFLQSMILYWFIKYYNFSLNVLIQSNNQIKKLIFKFLEDFTLKVEVKYY